MTAAVISFRKFVSASSMIDKGSFHNVAGKTEAVCRSVPVVRQYYLGIAHWVWYGREMGERGPKPKRCHPQDDCCIETGSGVAALLLQK